MAFVRTAYTNLPVQCTDLIESVHLENDIYFIAVNSKQCRVTFNHTLTAPQISAFENADCFVKFMDHDGHDAVLMTRFM